MGSVLKNAANLLSRFIPGGGRLVAVGAGVQGIAVSAEGVTEAAGELVASGTVYMAAESGGGGVYTQEEMEAIIKARKHIKNI